MAVLSSDAVPYREAYEGFKEALGRDVPILFLPPNEVLDVAPGVRVVAAFGGKAAIHPYPDGKVLVYLMAPGTRVSRRGDSIQVNMYPEPGRLAAELLDLQPSLRRVGVLWSSQAVSDAVEGLRRSFLPSRVEVLDLHVEKPGDYPERLRELKGRVDAIWLPPDPPLINEQNLRTLKEFCWANDIPFYAPTSGLVAMGAAASISVHYREIGRAAGRATLQALSGRVVAEHYPAQVEVTLNLQAAENSGLTFSPQALKKATKVIP